MTKTCTSSLNDVVRFIYNETTHAENVKIEKEIVKDNAVLNFYLDCITIKDTFNDIELCPNERTINNIFEYSKNYKPTI